MHIIYNRFVAPQILESDIKLVYGWKDETPLYQSIFKNRVFKCPLICEGEVLCRQRLFLAIIRHPRTSPSQIREYSESMYYVMYHPTLGTPNGCDDWLSLIGCG